MFRRVPFFPRARAAWAPSKASAGTIAVASPVRYKTLQRSGTTGTITISGTYTGSPTAIEASFNGGAYSTIDAAPAGGTFSGTLSGQAQGQGTLTVRFTNDTGVSATVSDVGIGDVFIVAGDSIADGRATNAQSYTHATLKATAFNQSDAWINGNDPIDIHASNGSHWPLLASQIMEDQGVPVAFITVGTGSTDIAGSATQWVKNNSSYAEMTAQVSASGVNAVKAALFHLGPNAVVNASTISQATYNAAVDTLASNILSDIAGAPKLHLGLFGEVTTGSPPDRRAAIDNIRAAIIEAQDDNSNVEPGPVLIDQDYSDGVHPKSDAELAIVAKRWWVALDESLYGGSGGRGPRLASARWNPARDQLTVTFDRNLKTGLSFGTGAWIISDNGTLMTITGVAYHGTDAAAVVLTTNAAASGALGTTTVSFASSNDAAGIVIPVSTDVTVPVGAAVQLPAEPLYAETVAESQVSLVVADALHAHSADAIGLSTASILNVAEALHAHAADNITVSVSGADTLTIADSTHAHTADALALTSASSLAIADASHAHTVDGLTLTAQSVLAIQEALHAHAAENLTLSADNSTPLLIADALHAHTSDGLALTVDAWLVIADALHGHTADNLTLELSGGITLTIADALHAHTADGVLLTVSAYLVVSDALHAHTADNILLSIPGAFRAGNRRAWIVDSRQRYVHVDASPSAWRV